MEKFTNINEVLSKIIQQITDQTESEDTFSRVNVDFSQKSFYVDKNVNKINHLSFETFYTKEYIDQIRALLGDYKGFLSLSDYDRKLIQLKLDVLSHDDYILKTYLHKSVHEAKNLYKLFPVSFDKFELFDELVKEFNENQNHTFKVSGDFCKVYKAEV
jgi:Mg2+/Co2+ transporter CorC